MTNDANALDRHEENCSDMSGGDSTSSGSWATSVPVRQPTSRQAPSVCARTVPTTATVVARATAAIRPAFLESNILFSFFAAASSSRRRWCRSTSVREPRTHGGTGDLPPWIGPSERTSPSGPRRRALARARLAALSDVRAAARGDRQDPPRDAGAAVDHRLRAARPAGRLTGSPNRRSTRGHH